MPVAVFVPKTAQDIVAAIQIAADLGVPVLPRGGGTSQCGQTTGPALVIDNSKYFRKYLDINLEQGYVDVQPGIVLDHLNATPEKTPALVSGRCIHRSTSNHWRHGR
jgi:FAD/FMN-containing dehydrogenase